MTNAELDQLVDRLTRKVYVNTAGGKVVAKRVNPDGQAAADALAAVRAERDRLLELASQNQHAWINAVEHRLVKESFMPTAVMMYDLCGAARFKQESGQ